MIESEGRSGKCGQRCECEKFEFDRVELELLIRTFNVYREFYGRLQLCRIKASEEAYTDGVRAQTIAKGHVRRWCVRQAWKNTLHHLRVIRGVGLPRGGGDLLSRCVRWSNDTSGSHVEAGSITSARLDFLRARSSVAASV